MKLWKFNLLWTKYPIVRVLIPYAAGLTFSIHTTIESLVLLIGFCIFLSLPLFLQFFKIQKQSWGNLFLGCFIQTFVFISAVFIANKSLLNKTDLERTIISGQILTDPNCKNNRTTFLFQLDGRYDMQINQWKVDRSKVKLSVTNAKVNYYKSGHLIVFLNTENPNHYLHIDQSNKAQWVSLDSKTKRFVLPAQSLKIISPARTIEQLRNSSFEFIQHTLHEILHDINSEALAKALLYGDDSELSPEIKNTFAQSGTLHVLAVSGMHVNILFSVLQFILLKIMPAKRHLRLRLLCGGVIIWIYTFFCGLGPSIVRAALMTSFSLLDNALGRRKHSIHYGLISVLILLIYQADWIFHKGFILSFGAVFGILIYEDKIYQWFTFKHPFGVYLWKNVSVSLAAQVFILPFSLYYFKLFPLWFIPANLIIVPFTTFILALLPLVFVANFFLSQEQIISLVYKKLIALLFEVADAFCHLPLKGVYMENANFYSLILLMLFILFFIQWLRYKRFESVLSAIFFILLLTINQQLLTYFIYCRVPLHYSNATHELAFFYADGKKVFSSNLLTIANNKQKLKLCEVAYPHSSVRFEPYDNKRKYNVNSVKTFSWPTKISFHTATFEKSIVLKDTFSTIEFVE